MTKKTMIMLSKYENQILELIYGDWEKMTTSDLQGVVQAIVLNIYKKGAK